MQNILKDDELITVCAECLTAACWHGEFMCEKAETADLTQKSVKELKELNLEHPMQWAKQIYGEEIRKNIEKEYGSVENWRKQLYGDFNDKKYIKEKK